MALQQRRRNPITDAPDLATAQARARKHLADASERARQQFMTGGDLKSAVYRQKQDEAEAWQALVDAAATPDPADFPYLRARALRLDAETPDYQAVADEWNTLAAGWLTVGPVIETLYENAMAAVAAATDVAAVAAAIAVSWPQPE